MFRPSSPLFVGAVLFSGGCYGQVAPLYLAESDLTSGSLVAAGSIGIVALKASAAMVARAELKNYNCGKKVQEQKQSCDIDKEEVKNQMKEGKEELQLIKKNISACKTPGYSFRFLAAFAALRRLMASLSNNGPTVVLKRMRYFC